ncbi:MAG: CPBP family intramembrane glutamic endopeptidase [Nanoarchaeota archaeon]
MVFPLIMEIALLVILPVLLIYFGIIPYKNRYHTMMVVVAIILSIVVFEGWSFERVGIRLDNISTTVVPYLLVTLIGSVAILIFVSYKGLKPQKRWWADPHFQYFFLISSLLQEFVFRSFFIAELQDVLASGFVIIILNALIFTFIHIIYSVDISVLTGTFLTGSLLAWLYVAYPNLILITISHAILNFLIVLYGNFRKEGITEKLKEKLNIERTA